MADENIPRVRIIGQSDFRSFDAPPTIPFDSIVWRESGTDEDKRARLLAPISIAGCSMHLEAYAVVYRDNGEQGFTIGFSDVESSFYSLVDSAVQTIEIEGREYALLATPYWS